MSRMRKLVWKQGKLAVVADMFIAALLHHRDTRMPIAQFIETLFCVPTRHLFFARAKRDFTLDGERMFAGIQFLVRHDETNPELFEIATLDDVDNVSRLTAAQWSEIKHSLAVEDKSAGPEVARLLS